MVRGKKEEEAQVPWGRGGAQQRNGYDVTRAGEGVQGLPGGRGGVAAADEKEAEERQRQLVQPGCGGEVQGEGQQQLRHAPATARAPGHPHQHAALQQQQQEDGKLPNLQHQDSGQLARGQRGKEGLPRRRFGHRSVNPQMFSHFFS